MLVNLILFLLPFLRLVSALTNATAAYGDSHIVTRGVWTESDTGCGHYTSTLNSSVGLTFNGVSIHVLGDLSLYGGIVQITLDGQPTRLIDLYGAASCGQVLFSSTGLANGQHFINLELIGETPNVTSKDGPARLFVFTNFIWSSLDPNSSSSLSPSPSTQAEPPSSTRIKRQEPSPPSPQPSPPPPSPQPSLPPSPPPPSDPPVVSPSPDPPSASPSDPPTVSPASPPTVSPSDPPTVSPSPPTVSPSDPPTVSPSSPTASPSDPPTVSPPTSSERPFNAPSSLPLSPSSSSSSSAPYSSPKRPPPPTSTLSSVPTVTAVASGPTPVLSGVLNLWTCKPYGSKDCAFNPQAPVGLNTHSLIVGTPAANCGPGTSNSIAVVGGQVTITDTWSQDLTAGLSLGGAAGDLVLNTSGVRVWENSQIQHLANVVNMTIPPKSQGALVAQVTYNSTNGTLQIGNELPFHVIANRPQNDVAYVANIIPCNANFNGNYTPTISSDTQSMKPYSHGIVVIVALTVRILL